ncbi:MAG TPA: hypothetical protein VGO67_06015 [Verrucomicrobiae bacterium]|jgi:hypothetical protein
MSLPPPPDLATVPTPKPLGSLSPAAQKVIQPRQTPCQQAQALNKQQLSMDAVKSLAHGLPEPAAIKWAAVSAEKVANPAHAADSQAIQAAKAWTQNPTPATQHAAGLAASKTDFKTPGAWAAQAAAWSGRGGGLSGHAVTGTVLLAAAQGGKPISPPGVSAPVIAVPTMLVPKASVFQLPFFKKPAAQAPPTLGPDGLTLTPAQRLKMSKNCDPFLKLGCDIGTGRA